MQHSAYVFAETKFVSNQQRIYDFFRIKFVSNPSFFSAKAMFCHERKHTVLKSYKQSYTCITDFLPPRNYL